VIATPHNDTECLGAITEEVAAMVRDGDEALVGVAQEHENTDSLADWIQSLPQRDDEGLPCDGPKVAECRPAQRLRIPAPDPNCVERAALYLGAAELLDPTPVRRLATVNTPAGLHTLPTEDGEPVILDPRQSRNALRAGLFHAARNAGVGGPDNATRRLRLERLIGTDETKGTRGDLARARASKAAGYTTWVHGEPIDEAIAKYERTLAAWQEALDALPRNAAGGPDGRGVVALTPAQAVDWIAELAAEPAGRFVQGPERVRNGHRAVQGVFIGRPLCVADVRDVAFMLALAEREARLYGPAGPRIVKTTAHAVDRLDQLAAEDWKQRTAPRNAPELQIGGYRISPNTPLLASLARVGGRLGGKVGLEALRVKLAGMGISPPVLNSIEHELNREGLTLGGLAAPPPMLGTLGALTPEALAGRWLAGKV